MVQLYLFSVSCIPEPAFATFCIPDQKIRSDA